MAVVASPEQMDQSAANIEDRTEQINAALEQIKNRVNSIGANWKDESGKTFGEKFDELQREMPQYIDRAHACGAFMKGVSNAYRETVRINQAAVRTDQVQ